MRAACTGRTGKAAPRRSRRRQRAHCSGSGRQRRSAACRGGCHASAVPPGLLHRRCWRGLGRHHSAHALHKRPACAAGASWERGNAHRLALPAAATPHAECAQGAACRRCLDMHQRSAARLTSSRRAPSAPLCRLLWMLRLCRCRSIQPTLAQTPAWARWGADQGRCRAPCPPALSPLFLLARLWPCHGAPPLPPPLLECKANVL